MKKKYLSKKISAQRGQALIILIVAISLALLVLTSAVLRSIGQAKFSARNKLGQKVYYAAEAGVEYGLIKTLRDPNNCSGSDAFTLDSATVNVTYNIAGSNCQITSEATEGNLIKKIQVESSYNSSKTYETCCWLEVP